MSKKTTLILLMLAAATLVGGCTLSDIWLCLIGFSNCGWGSANQSTVVTYVDPPDIPCSYSKAAEPINVTVSGSADMNPPIQYCFVKITGAQEWISTPQAFGPGTTTLSFAGFIPDYADYEVVVGLTPDSAVASLGDPDMAAVVKKTQMNLAMAGTKKCPLIEYDCMAGYDIRGPSDTSDNSSLYKYTRKRFFEGNTELVYIDDELGLPAQLFSRSADLDLYIWDHFEKDFSDGTDSADFYLLAIQNCINRAHFYGDSLKDSLGTGVSALSSTAFGGAMGQRGSNSIIFRGFIDSLFVQSSRQTVYGRSSVHEFGHALIGLSDVWKKPSEHNGGINSSCVMNLLVRDSVSHTLVPGWDKFCSSCKTRISNHSW